MFEDRSVTGPNSGWGVYILARNKKKKRTKRKGCMKMCMFEKESIVENACLAVSS